MVKQGVFGSLGLALTAAAWADAAPPGAYGLGAGALESSGGATASGQVLAFGPDIVIWGPLLLLMLLCTVPLLWLLWADARTPRRRPARAAKPARATETARARLGT
jgi:hypothetical protein